MMSRGMQQQEAVVSARFCPVMLVEAIDNLVGNGRDTVYPFSGAT